MMSGLTNRILKAVISLFFTMTLNAQASWAADFDDYVQRLAEHPQVQRFVAEGKAFDNEAQGAIGLPDPMLMLGVDNMPVSDPEFDRFLPTSKVIGFSQAVPNPYERKAKRDRYRQMSEKQQWVADYTENRLRAMLVSYLADYQNVQTKQALINEQLSYYRQLEDTFKGQVEAGGAAYQRFSEIDVERAEAERNLNDLKAKQDKIEAEFIRLVSEVPDIEVPEIEQYVWDGVPEKLFPVRIASEALDVAGGDVAIADAAFLPDFGVSATYKQREDGRNGSFSGDDWFSIQAQVSIPLWASDNQKPKLRAARERENSARYAYEDVKREWVMRMKAMQSQRDAAAENVKILQDKSTAMKKKIEAARRNYEAGTENLDTVLLAQIDRLRIRAQLSDTKASYMALSADYNSHLIMPQTGVEELLR